MDEGMTDTVTSAPAERTITVLTAASPGRGLMLLRAHNSLAHQVLPPGWAWQWVIQEDAERPSLETLLPKDPRIEFDFNGGHFGPAITRNLALIRARGGIVRNLDDDDELAPDALALDIEAFVTHPGLAWVTSEAADVTTHGEIKRHSTPFPAGPVAAGALTEAWLLSPERVPPVHPATMCVKTDVLRSLGGWMAMPFSEDTGLLMATASRFPGRHGGHVSLFYHRGPLQVSETQSLKTRESKSARAALITQRIRAMDAVFGRTA